MTANERFTALMRSMPMIKSDFDADGNLTEEAGRARQRLGVGTTLRGRTEGI